jgi:hypothetical protein
VEYLTKLLNVNHAGNLSVFIALTNGVWENCVLHANKIKVITNKIYSLTVFNVVHRSPVIVDTPCHTNFTKNMHINVKRRKNNAL